MVLKKIFFKLMNSAVFGKTMKNMRKHKDIKLVTTKRRRSYFVLERNFMLPRFSQKKSLKYL